jgi:hypothetical protein
MAKPDPNKLLSMHRDGGTSRRPTLPEIDAPSPRHSDYTGAELSSAFRSVDPGSDAEKALIAVVDMLASRGGAPGGGGDGLSRGFVTKLLAGALAVLTVLLPTVEQLAERLLSPTSALERKLDETLAGQAQLQQQQQEQRLLFVALSKWVVTVELAREAGVKIPDPPPAVRLILVQDELIQSTGP